MCGPLLLGIPLFCADRYSNNIGQIAYLQAQNHNLEHIYFGGSFIRGEGLVFLFSFPTVTAITIQVPRYITNWYLESMMPIINKPEAPLVPSARKPLAKVRLSGAYSGMKNSHITVVGCH